MLCEFMIFVLETNRCLPLLGLPHFAHLTMHNEMLEFFAGLLLKSADRFDEGTQVVQSAVHFVVAKKQLANEK